MTRWAESARGLAGRIRPFRPLVEAALLGTVSLLAVLAMGVASAARSAELEREAVRLESLGERMDDWIEGLEPPTPAESAAWRSSDRQLAALGGDAGTALALVGQLTRRAEEVGVSDLRVRLADPDSVPEPPPVEAGGLVVGATGSPLEVELVDDWSSVVGFFGTLPYTLQVSSVRIGAVGGEVRVRAVLFPRDLAGSR